MEDESNLQSVQLEYSVEQVNDLIGKSMILDVRPKIFWEFGNIEGSISFPEEELRSVIEQYQDQLDKASKAGTPIITYCSGGHCDDAEKVRDRLAELGIDAGVFTGGWEMWEEFKGL